MRSNTVELSLVAWINSSLSQLQVTSLRTAPGWCCRRHAPGKQVAVGNIIDEMYITTEINITTIYSHFL